MCRSIGSKKRRNLQLAEFGCDVIERFQFYHFIRLAQIRPKSSKLSPPAQTNVDQDYCEMTISQKLRSLYSFVKFAYCNELISCAALELPTISCVRCRIEMCWSHFYYIRSSLSTEHGTLHSHLLTNLTAFISKQTLLSLRTLLLKANAVTVSRILFIFNIWRTSHNAHAHTSSRTQHDIARSPTPIGHRQTISIGWHAKSVAIHISVEHQVKLKLNSSSCRVTADTTISLNMTTMDSPSFILTARANIMADPMPKQDSAYILLRKTHCEYYFFFGRFSSFEWSTCSLCTHCKWQFPFPFLSIFVFVFFFSIEIASGQCRAAPQTMPARFRRPHSQSN